MAFTPFTFEQHQQFLLDTLRTKLPKADLSPGSFWQIWAQGQARGLAGITQALNTAERQILPDRATGIDLDHHAEMFDIPRLLPDKAVGKVRVTITSSLLDPAYPSEPTLLSLLKDNLVLKDIDGREYALLDEDQLVHAIPGLYEIDVEAGDAGADGNQVPDVELSFYTKTGDALLSSDYPDIGLEDVTWVVEPGITGGRDQESDAALSTRISEALSAGRFSDTVEDYKKWVLDHHWTRRADRAEEYGLVLDNVHNAWVYRDDVAPNRVYIMALNPPPNRIATDGFLQAVYNAIEEKSPVTVDPIVPMIREEGIDITVCVEPRAQARWDWVGVKMVAASSTDRKICLHRGVHPESITHGLTGPTLMDYDGADGLEPGMRVLIGGEERTIGHIDRDEAGEDPDILFLTEDLSVIPNQYAPVYPGGPVTEQVHDGIARLFETLGPLHKTLIGTDGEQNVLVSVVTDTVMEIADVHDAFVHTPEQMFRDGLLEADAYLLGLLAYLAVPGRISVVPMVEKARFLVDDGVPTLPYDMEKL